MLNFGAVILICLTVICVVFFYVTVNQTKHRIDMSERIRLQKITEKRPTHHIDHDSLDTRCEICFGDIGSEVIKVCDCGRIFHLDCADATDECPYCRRKKETMTERNARKTKCPYCGRIVKDNICDCGAIIPNEDGTYVCKCGEIASLDSNGCRKCGSSVRFEINN